MSKKVFFTPGPSGLYYTVEEHIKQALKEYVPSISHRSKAFEAIYAEAVENVKLLLNIPKEHHIFFTGSATEIWERIIQNLVARESYHLVNGSFSKRFQEISSELGKVAHTFKSEEGTCPNINQMLVGETNELIAICQNETSTGAALPLDDIYTLRKAFPEMLLAVDAVSSLPYINLDFKQIDTAYFSVQKGFGLPAGLGVWIMNKKCIEKARSLEDSYHIGTYHSIPSLLEKGMKNQTPETPNVLGLYLLGKVAGDMLHKGIDQIRRETEYKAAVLYNAIENSPLLSPFVKDPNHRSKTVIVAETKSSSKEIISRLSQKGLIVGSGYGGFKEKQIRIANFPTHSKEHIEMLSDLLLQEDLVS
jgi:phosphoserine aminotransferase